MKNRNTQCTRNKRKFLDTNEKSFVRIGYFTFFYQLSQASKTNKDDTL